MASPNERTHDSTVDQTPDERPTNRVTVADAARLLGLSAEAVRIRIKRGTLASEKVEGTVYVILDADPTRPNYEPTTNQTTDPTTDQTVLVEVLHDRWHTYASNSTRSAKPTARTGASSPGLSSASPSWKLRQSHETPP